MGYVVHPLEFIIYRYFAPTQTGDAFMAYNIQRGITRRVETQVQRWLLECRLMTADLQQTRSRTAAVVEPVVGELSQCEIDQILQTEIFGRIGYQVDGRPYVCPITYFYDDAHIYGFISAAIQLPALPPNAEICFQVDRLGNNGHWQSVSVWGLIETVRGRVVEQVKHNLLDRLRTQHAASAPLAAYLPTIITQLTTAHHITLARCVGQCQIGNATT
jgi:hypothetical protein